ncbi:MAG: hypothetical protein US01_C0001G0766 [candidate division TM6 bacterium GW2011_GWF2_28_16]|nr:MAG: hypothetical protein US01_C0001G0766 [candidate division TM6 bacterium GW2011_GWF2_28_16]HAZ73585.1 hypothetical protein [Candidatus Paceibacterota bacterium]
MRILKFFFFSMLWILGLGLLAFLFGREILLALESNIIKNDYNSLLNKNYAAACTNQFSYSQDYWTQIKFTSDKEYNLEVVCSDFATSPIVLSSKKMLPLVSKASFGSGFIINDQKLPSFIELEVLGRNLYIYTDAQKIYSNYLSKPDFDYDQGPLSSCEAHNYQCCSLDVQSGLGEQLTSVNDCPKSCYESCLFRPSILLFNSQPALDETTRTIEVLSGETISFSYVLGNGKNDVFSGQISRDEETSWLQKLQAIFSRQKVEENDGIALPVEVNIDFGDGETWQSASLQDSVDHSYICQTKTCYFQVKISAKDVQGVLSVDNELAKMIVKVNR